MASPLSEQLRRSLVAAVEDGENFADAFKTTFGADVAAKREDFVADLAEGHELR